MYFLVSLVNFRNILGSIVAIFEKTDNFCGFLFALLSQTPSEKGSPPYRKDLLPVRANSFLVEQTIFQKGTKTFLIELYPLKVYQCPLIHYINCQLICYDGGCICI